MNRGWIVVTGAAGGIGRALVERLDREGDDLLLIDLPGSGVAALAEHLPGGGRAVGVESRLEDVAACERALAAVEGSVYGLAHLAGVMEEDPALGRDHGVWDRVMAANLANAYDVATVVAERLPPDRMGRMVFVSSLAFRRGGVDVVAYSAAKGGLVGMTRALARRFGKRATVNAVAPGIIKTRMPEHLIARRGERLLQEIPLGRFGEPGEVAAVIVFLLGEASSYVTGQTLNVDGGQING